MRKKDFNFVLTKDNVFEFEKRLNKLLMITECLSCITYYRNKIIPNNILLSAGIKSHILNIMESDASYIVNGKMSYDTYPSNINLHSKECVGIIIRAHEDCTIVVYFGQKIKFTPTEIIFNQKKRLNFDSKYDKYKGSTETRINIYQDLERAKQIIHLEEQLAEDYYDSLYDDEDY